MDRLILSCEIINQEHSQMVHPQPDTAYFHDKDIKLLNFKSANWISYKLRAITSKRFDLFFNLRAKCEFFKIICDPGSKSGCKKFYGPFQEYPRDLWLDIGNCVICFPTYNLTSVHCIHKKGKGLYLLLPLLGWHEFENLFDTHTIRIFIRFLLE